MSIRWTPFAWKTLTAKAGPGLFALRTVSTPDGETTQGFEVSEERLADFLKGARLPARLLPGPPGNPAEARLPLEGAEWCVAVSVPDTGKGAEAVQASFRRRFLGGASLVLLAGVCVVALVHQAERLAGQRSRFAASAAHELRTPLAGLRMYGEMLAEGLGDPARAGDYARRISAEAERLGRVVSNVLGFTRLERGGLSARPETGDLATALREMAERQKPGLEAAGASLVLEIPAGALPACFDRDALAQVVQNLLDNAEKHARGAADRRILLSLKPVGGGAEVSVSDRGPGVPAALRGRLFRPFARGGSSDAPEGLGLGLSVSKALAEAQGGRLSFSPAEGGGAVFTVFLSA